MITDQNELDTCVAHARAKALFHELLINKLKALDIIGTITASKIVQCTGGYH